MILDYSSTSGTSAGRRAMRPLLIILVAAVAVIGWTVLPVEHQLLVDSQSGRLQTRRQI